MKLTLFPKRFSLLKTFISIFITLSFLVRLVFLIWNFSEIDTSVFKLISAFAIGFLFDIGTVSFFAIPYIIYLLLIPSKIYGTLFDRIITYFGFSIGLIIFLFSFFAEITFWEEFKRRFNFIAVDYLLYTYEVVNNINESYPLPLLIGLILLILFGIIIAIKKKGVFKETFTSTTPFKTKLAPSILLIIIASIFALFINNKDAELFKNRYNNEISKTGIYSFFAAFRSSEFPFTEFYKTIDNDKAFRVVKNKIKTTSDSYINETKHEIIRNIKNSDSINEIQKPNVIFICVESLSGAFLKTFGSKQNITPVLDSLANNSIFFTNLFATGTRTVRGMEAITLSIPPTPGRSILKRDNSQNLFTIGEVFKEQGYERNFFYGGDGYFDNMNSFFGTSGFNIIDRGRGFLLDSNIKTKRTNIEDNEVTFENAWGVCDTDIYNKVISEADKASIEGKPFFDFVMTTSNHRPYTYPENKIDVPSGAGRHGSVKYTDYAIGEFIKKVKNKPWYKNTIFIIMSDHCASSAGSWALDVQNYHVPAFIFNVPNTKHEKIDKLCSQIDLFPTLFSMLNWNYSSNFFGKNILEEKNEGRTFIGNYRKVGLLKDNKLMVLGDQQKTDLYTWDKTDNSLKEIPLETDFLEETISYYQVADYLYRNNGLKLKQ
ncbi:LTA synthase family protein [Thalassobellus citreus]|uniref:LTA synthase family protein n=1 Tax=Thalassobellus citreus TaxID=3367752 RepID=UPI0037A4CA8C